MRPDNVTDEAWQAAVMKARQDPHTARRLVQRGLLIRNGGPAMRLPEPPRNPTIRPNRKKQRSKRR